MNLPNPSPAYDPQNESQARRTILEEDARNRKSDQDIDMGANRFILTSPDGTRFTVTVADDGTISATAL